MLDKDNFDFSNDENDSKEFDNDDGDIHLNVHVKVSFDDDFGDSFSTNMDLNNSFWDFFKEHQANIDEYYLDEGIGKIKYLINKLPYDKREAGLNLLKTFSDGDIENDYFETPIITLINNLVDLNNESKMIDTLNGMLNDGTDKYPYYILKTCLIYFCGMILKNLKILLKIDNVDSFVDFFAYILISDNNITEKKQNFMDDFARSINSTKTYSLNDEKIIYDGNPSIINSMLNLFKSLYDMGSDEFPPNHPANVGTSILYFIKLAYNTFGMFNLTGRAFLDKIVNLLNS